MTDMKDVVGKNIRRIRTEKNMSQEVLADLVGVAQPRISEIESGTYCPRLGTIERIATSLRVDMGALLQTYVPTS